MEEAYKLPVWGRDLSASHNNNNNNNNNNKQINQSANQSINQLHCVSSKQKMFLLNIHRFIDNILGII